MKKLLFVLPLFFLFFIPNDTFASTTEYQNPKMDMVGFDPSVGALKYISSCDACSELQNTYGIPEVIRIWFPATLFNEDITYTISFQFRWVYNGMYDVWPTLPTMFYRSGDGGIMPGADRVADEFSIKNWTYTNGYQDSGYWFRFHDVTVSLKGSFFVNILGYYYIDIPFMENTTINDVEYPLNFKLEMDRIIISDSSSDTDRVINNAADRIVESNEINKHANQENFDKVQETLKDTDTTGSQGFAKDFFNTFRDEDNHGISTIVKAPLVMIQSLISDSDSSRCSNLNFEILGSSVYFPSGCSFWSKVPDSVRSIYYLIICGFFGYKLVISLFKDTQRLKSPNNSEVTTLDL